MLYIIKKIRFRLFLIKYYYLHKEAQRFWDRALMKVKKISLDLLKEIISNI